jgi:oligosaccharide repeat unit polymerase
MTSWSILIPLCFFLFVLLRNILRTKHVVTFYNLLLMLYSFSLICNIASGLYSAHQFPLSNTLFFTLAVYLFMNPFRSLRLDCRPAFPSSPSRYFRVVALIVIALSLTSIFFDFSVALDALRSGDFNLFRQSVVAKALLPGLVRPPQSVLEIASRFSNSLYFISLTLFFVALVKRTGRILTFFLFISSFSNLLFHFTQAGRTGVVLWMFFFFINFLFFRRFMSPEIATRVKSLFLATSLCLLTVFVVISRNRFSDYLYYTTDGTPVTNPIAGTLDYLGQPFANFDNFLKTGFSPRFNGAFLFPLVDRALSFGGFYRNTQDEMYALIRESIPENCYSFATFLRELWYDFGPVGVIILGLVFSVLVRSLCKKLNETVRVSGVLLLFCLYSIPFMGLFSYPLSQMNDNFGLLAILFIPF